jgi:L-amino acid N-acyltransferase YncA
MNKAAIQLADARNGTPKYIHIEELFSSSSRLTMAQNAGSLVDGNGAQRICNAMNMPKFNIRNATIEDAEILWEWSNDKATRAASFNSDPIPWENHLAWLTTQLESKNVFLLIVESALNKFGVIRYNLDAESANETIISIGLAPESRGKGLAPLIISQSAAHFFNLHPDQVITAWIKPENKASIQSFIKANFEDYPSLIQPNQIRMRLVNNLS